jgi:hypothetical protein
VPIDLLGFDLRELLRRMVETIDHQRRGDAVARFEIVPARFSSELPSDGEMLSVRSSAELESRSRERNFV